MAGSGIMAGMDHSAMMSIDTAYSEKGYETAMAGMMEGMMFVPTGKPDLEFMLFWCF
jgi:hypothetical protein